MAGEKIPETSDEILEQIRNADIAGEDIGDEEETDLIEETESAETEESEEEEAEETSTEETEAAEEKEEATKPRLFKLIVDGKEEYVTEEQMHQYAQKGRYLERERAKDKEGHEFDYEKAEEELKARIGKDGLFKPLAELAAGAIKADRMQMRETRKQGRLLADNAEWGKDSALREQFFDLLEEGHTPDAASTEVALKFWKEFGKEAQAKGAEKQKKKVAADIKKGKEAIDDVREAGSEEATMEGFEKLESDPKTKAEDLLKYMKKAGVPIGRDVL